MHDIHLNVTRWWGGIAPPPFPIVVPIISLKITIQLELGSAQWGTQLSPTHSAQVLPITKSAIPWLTHAAAAPPQTAQNREKTNLDSDDSSIVSCCRCNHRLPCLRSTRELLKVVHNLISSKNMHDCAHSQVQIAIICHRAEFNARGCTHARGWSVRESG